MKFLLTFNTFFNIKLNQLKIKKLHYINYHFFNLRLLILIQKSVLNINLKTLKFYHFILIFTKFPKTLFVQNFKSK